MDESNSKSPCKEYNNGADEAQLHAEVENLRQHVAEKDAHIVGLEAEFVKCTARANDLEEQVDTWREKYERLYDSHKRVQKLNQVLEDKLLQMVDRMKSEKSQLTKDIATLSVRLAESKHNYSMLQKENERYKNDMNLAIQLLQCKPDNFVSQKLDNLPVDTQARVSQYVMSKTSKPGSSSQSKNGNDLDTFDAMVDEVSESRICRKCAERKASLEISETWRRHCGCIKTSDKLRRIIDNFPAPPPPSPVNVEPANKSVAKLHNGAACISAFCTVHQSSFLPEEDTCKTNEATSPVTLINEIEEQPPLTKRSWAVVTELVQLLQLSVTATALALYYLIYCYMQLVYYTLRSALYFHNADGPMKITIGVVTLTSLIVGFNLLLRIERLIFSLH